jgi:hypothetical protein
VLRATPRCAAADARLRLAARLVLNAGLSREGSGMMRLEPSADEESGRHDRTREARCP